MASDHEAQFKLHLDDEKIDEFIAKLTLLKANKQRMHLDDEHGMHIELLHEHAHAQ